MSDTSSPNLAACLRFPLSTPEARRDLLVGGTVLLVPLVGWILNLGHRLDVVYRIYHDEPPLFRGFAPWPKTFLRGLQAFCAICIYLSPAALAAAAAYLSQQAALAVVAGALCTWGVFSLPGGMTYNAAYGDISYLYRPDRAFARALSGGRAYLKAWAIALLAITLSLLGLALLGIGFLYTSVWAWMVVGYAFSQALSLRQHEDAHSKEVSDAIAS